MTLALMFSALFMGIAGALHCVAMCSAASAGVVAACGGRLRNNWLTFLGGRLLGYSAAGALAATSVVALGRLGEWSPALRPLWTAAHLIALGLGLWMLWRGVTPSWMDRLGRSGTPSEEQPVSWRPKGGILKSGGLGMLWFAWPCGLLHSALLVAALANGPLGGGLVMACFAVGSSPALAFGPWLVRRMSAHEGAGADLGLLLQRRLTRLAGGLLAVGSGWALGHGLWIRVWAWCVS